MNKALKIALKVGASIAINAAVGYVVMGKGGALDPKDVVKVAKNAKKKVCDYFAEVRTELLEDK